MKVKVEVVKDASSLEVSKEISRSGVIRAIKKKTRFPTYLQLYNNPDTQSRRKIKESMGGFDYIWFVFSKGY